jgi:WS/DGAT/MGAT family acyltransferase
MVEADDFDVTQHLEHVTLPSPGDSEELANIVGKIAGRPLDRHRPLWEAWIIDGLEDGRVAFLTKVHHALIDGTAGTEVLGKLFELSPNSDDVFSPTISERDDEGYGALQMLASAASSAVAQPLRMLRATTNTISSLTRAFYDQTLAAADDQDLAAKPFIAPRNVFTQSVSAKRVVGLGRTPMDDILTIKRSCDATINDVVLAACTQALREYLLHRGESVEHPLVATVPVAVAHDDEGDDLGNHVSVMFVFLPIHLEDMQARIDFIKGSTAAAKQARSALGDTLLDDWLAAAPARLLHLGAQVFSWLRLGDLIRPAHNLVISNVRGPISPMYSAGAMVESCYPLGPVMDGAALNITVMSYRDSIDVGIIACPRSVPDPALIARGFECAVREAAERIRNSEQGSDSHIGPPNSLPLTST